MQGIGSGGRGYGEGSIEDLRLLRPQRRHKGLRPEDGEGEGCGAAGEAKDDRRQGQGTAGLPTDEVSRGSNGNGSRIVRQVHRGPPRPANGASFWVPTTTPGPVSCTISVGVPSGRTCSDLRNSTNSSRSSFWSAMNASLDARPSPPWATIAWVIVVRSPRCP